MKRTSSRRARSGAEGALAARELGIAALRAVRGALLLLKLASGRVATAAAARELGVAALRAVRGAVRRTLVSGRAVAARELGVPLVSARVAAAARELGVAALRAVRGAVHRLNLVSGRVAAARAAMEPA